MAEYSRKDTKIFLALVLLSLFSLSLLSVPFVQGVTVSTVGTMAGTRGWLFSQSAPLGIYYGFGYGDNWCGGTARCSDLYYFDFATESNSLIKSDTSTPLVWGDSLYSTIIGDKIFIADFYNPFDPSKGASVDANGLYAIDTKTNSFYLYDRLPFDFFVDYWPSPMAAVGTDLYFFVGIPGRPDIASRGYRYNPATKETTILAELPKELGSGGIVYAAGSNIYITTYNWGSENSLYVYDTLKDGFTYLATSPLIPSNNYRSNSVINGKLYFVGGEEPVYDTALNTIVEYDPSTNQFSVIDSLSYGLLGASTTSLSGSLYVVGGEVHSEPGITDSIIKIEILNPISEIEKSCPANGSYKNHGKYVSCVSKKAEEFFNSGLITEQQKNEIVSKAAKSNIGKK